jgi:hypothetical protein
MPRRHQARPTPAHPRCGTQPGFGGTSSFKDSRRTIVVSQSAGRCA